MRSLWKGPFILQKVYNSLVYKDRKFFYLKKKNNIILPEFIGLKIKIYNGQKYFDLHVTSNMVGYKFGSFIFTRKLHVFKSKKR